MIGIVLYCVCVVLYCGVMCGGTLYCVVLHCGVWCVVLCFHVLCSVVLSCFMLS